MGACTPPNRLASWSVEKPSAKQAATNPVLAAVRAALATVPGAIVGPSTPDVCTDAVAIVVPLRGAPGAYRTGKLALRTRAASYDATSDGDKLQLSCVPPP